MWFHLNFIFIFLFLFFHFNSSTSRSFDFVRAVLHILIALKFLKLVFFLIFNPPFFFSFFQSFLAESHFDLQKEKNNVWLPLPQLKAAEKLEHVQAIITLYYHSEVHVIYNNNDQKKKRLKTTINATKREKKIEWSISVWSAQITIDH